MWTSTDEGAHSREQQHAINITEAINVISEFATEYESPNIVAIVVEGMTSRELVINAKEFPYLRKVIKNAQMYTNLKDPFVFEAFKLLNA